jgi:hypothetical protein
MVAEDITQVCNTEFVAVVVENITEVVAVVV